MADPLTILSLCTGGGGLDRGVHRAVPGARTVCGVEWDAFACSVLASAFENGLMAPFPVWSDLGSFDARRWHGCVDLVVAGIPCQGNSLAGKRLLNDDPRNQWPNCRRIVRDSGAQGLFLENVRGFLVPGGGREAPILRVLDELADDGFDAEWGLFSAAQVGAPHKRERVFVLAYRQGRGRDGRRVPVQPLRLDGPERDIADAVGGGEALGDAGGQRSQRFLETGPAQGSTGRACGALEHAGYPPGPGLGGHGTLDRIIAAFRAGGPEKARRMYEAELAETERWVERLRESPEIEPAVCGLPDGLAATRREWLRVLGNGVVEATAALAFTTLDERFGR